MSQKKIRICIYCKKDFSGIGKRGLRKYCSVACALRDRKNAHPELCRAISERMKGNIFRFGLTTSDKQKEIARLLRTGKNNPLWKGGKSRGYKTGYYSARYKNWRREIFIRDEFTCRKCGKKHIFITAHHIKSFAYFPELRFEVDNGLTLCEDCHKETDNYKGRAKLKQGA